jgi:hypothetical protein
MGVIQSPRHKTEINCIVIDKVKTRRDDPLLPADSTVTGNDMITMKSKNHINSFYWGKKHGAGTSTSYRAHYICLLAPSITPLNLSKSLQSLTEGDRIKDDEMDGVCSMHERENTFRTSVWKI